MATQGGTVDDAAAATRVVLSYPADFGDHGRWRIGQDYYKKYLRRTRNSLEIGDEWQEFTDIGCCGNQMHVIFRVEAIEGGDAMGPDTEIEYTEREACGLASGWAVQGDEPDPA